MPQKLFYRPFSRSRGPEQSNEQLTQAQALAIVDAVFCLFIALLSVLLIAYGTIRLVSYWAAL